MYPSRFFLALGVTTFLLTLLLLAPLARVQSWLGTSSPLRALALEGNLLEGQARWHAGAQELEWTLSPGWLLLAGLGGDWRLDGDGLEARGDFLWQPWRLAVGVERAGVAPARLNSYLAATGAEVDQPLLARDLSLRFGPFGGLRSAEGRLAFGPGRLQLRDRAAPLDLPALRGTADTAGGRILVVIDGEAGPGQALASVDYTPATGEAHASVLQRGAGLFGVASPPGRSPDSVLFEWRQRLR